jgi:flagellar basal body P-ring formation protein FlgA
MKRLLIFGGLCFLGLAANLALGAEGVVIQLPEKATVIGPTITLGEIVEVISDNKAVADRLRRLTLGRAAPAGATVKMTLGYLKVALRREGYSLKDFSFGGAETVEILSQSQFFDPETLLPQVKSFILAQTGEAPENVDVKLEGAEKKIALPAGEVSAKFRPSFTGQYEGTVFLTTELNVDGRLVRVLPVRATVEIYHPAVTVIKKIDKGEKFTLENIALARTPSSKLINGCFQQLGNVLGRTASMPLAPGTVVRVNELYDPPAISRGQVVEGIVEKGNIELSVQVRAIEDGKAGDVIRVENTDSHKVLHGKVLDEKTVLLEPEVEQQQSGGAP